MVIATECIRGAITVLAILLGTLASLAWADMMPSFIKEPTSAVVSHHDNVTLPCDVVPPSAAVRWLRDGQTLDPSDSPDMQLRGTSLHFTQFKYSSRSGGNSGVYRCVVTTSLGSLISQPAVLSKPVLKKFLDQEIPPILVPVGGFVVLPCQPPESIPKARVVFVDKDGQTMDTSRGNVRQLPSGNILIENVQESDSGSYRCVVINPVSGQNRSANFPITLQIQQPGSNVSSFTKLLETRRTRLLTQSGSDIILECPIAGYPSPNVTWEKYAGGLPQNRFRIEKGNLHIQRVQVKDAGTYLCKTKKQSEQKIIEVEVQERPTVQVNNPQIVAQAGEKVDLRCEVQGYPEPKVSWYHNAAQIGRSLLVSRGGAVHSIGKVAPSHAGLYQCMAANNASVTYGLITLEVKGQVLEPAKNTGTETTTDEVGTTNETTDDLAAQTGVNTPTTNERRKPGKGRRKKHKGRKKGRRRKNRKHKGKAILVPPSQPTVTQLSETSVMLNWTVPQNDGLPITFFRVQYKELGPRKGQWQTEDMEIDPNKRRYEVSKLKSAGTYKFRIAAVYSNNDNKVGANSQRFTLKVEPRKEPRPPEEAPKIVEVIPVEVENVYAIGIKWQYNPVASSPIVGFYIHYKIYDSPGDYNNTTLLGATIRSGWLTQLKPDTEYSMKMQCFNSAGVSRFSNIVVTRTPSAGSSQPPPFLPDSTKQPGTGSKGGAAGDKPSAETNNGDGAEEEEEPTPNDPSKTSTQSSSEMLYMILGIVLGVMLLLLFIFMFMCWWKQRQQQRMMVMNGMINAKFQDQAQRIYSDSMRKKYMNGYPLNGLNGMVANGHVPHNNHRKMNINVNPLSEFETRSHSVSNGSVHMYSGHHPNTSDNNFNSIGHAKNGDDWQSGTEQQTLNGSHVGLDSDQETPVDGESPVTNGHTQSPSSFQTKCAPLGHGQNGPCEGHIVGMDTYACRANPRMHLPVSCEHIYGGSDGGDNFVPGSRQSRDLYSSTDLCSGSHSNKHKRRRKRPHSREHSTKDQATNTDLSSNEGTIEFTTFNKSPSSPSDPSARTFTNNSTQCSDFTQLSEAL